MGVIFTIESAQKMVSHEETRKKRMNKIKATLLLAFEEGKYVDKERFIAMCCFEWGSSRRKVLEYINIVELSSDFKIEWEKK